MNNGSRSDEPGVVAHPSALTRRQFLRGTGGATMLLPLLPSLMPREAHAQATAPKKRFIFIGTEHGGATFDNMYGTQGSTGATPVALWAGSTAQSSPLALATAGGNASLSPILTAPSGVLTSAIVKKMNVIRGIDYTNTVGHQSGSYLGNNNAQVDATRAAALKANVTIDQLMAYSPNFYTEIPRVRSINIGQDRALSWTYTNPSTRTGVQKLQRYSTSLSLFNSIFATGGAPVRPLIIDRVLDNYKSLSQSNRRLSAADKVRLDDHVGRLTQLQQQFSASAKPLSCGMPPTPMDNTTIENQLDNKGLGLDQQTTYYKLMADVLLTAFSCGASRIAVFHEEFPYSAFQGDWHQDIAHQWQMDKAQATLAASYQQVFEHVFMYLANGLDSIKDPDGSSLLDNSLLYWTQECGFSTHDPWAVPIVMAGGAAGYFKTGMLVDYRNQVASSQNTVYAGALPGNFSGLIYPQFLATALASMGVKSTEWTPQSGVGGYGDYKTDAASCEHFITNGVSTRPDGVYKNASQPLPIITNA
ncbi:MAG: hypothetical protein JWM82_4488 [Myxococcales bacterium]|nr:hypothetical protein [Myxococcales bacterium]